MEGTNRTHDKQTLASSWEQIRLRTLLRVCLLPSVVPTIVIGGLYAWFVLSGEPISSSMYSILLYVPTIVLFVALTFYYAKQYEIPQSQMTIVMGFSGLLVGFFVAIIKLIVNFEMWGVFRLISEPVFTALFAGIIGVLTVWGKRRLPVGSDEGII